MRTFNDYVKDFLASNTTTTNGTLAGSIVENIQWAWENCDFDWRDYTDTKKVREKPLNYTDEFLTEWVDDEPFEVEIEKYKEEFGNELNYHNFISFLTSKSNSK